MASEALVPHYSSLLKTCRDLYDRAYMAARKGLLEFYWDLGTEILKAMGDERNKYGEATISRLSSDLSLGKTTIYNCLALAGKFGKRDLSFQLSWKHFCALLPLPTDTARTLATRADDEAMPVSALKAEVARVREKRYEGRPARLAGTRLATALNPLSGIPSARALVDLRMKEIDVESLKRLRRRVDSAQEKIDRIRSFINGLKVVSPVKKNGKERKEGEMEKTGMSARTRKSSGKKTAGNEPRKK